MESEVRRGLISFTAIIRKEGINPYVDPPLGSGKTLGVERGMVPVNVSLDGKNFHANLVQLGPKRTKAAPGLHHRLYLHGVMRRSIGKDVGDRVKVKISFNSRPPVVPMNKALALKLQRDVKAGNSFKGLSPSHQKELNRYLNHLKSHDALQRNVDKVMRYLRQSQATWFGKKKPQSGH